MIRYNWLATVWERPLRHEGTAPEWILHSIYHVAIQLGQ